jgi:glycosyltransferase involved in cell wall biosynthesis
MSICFSIIIPTFNSANTIQNCISSIINQSFFNFEILIIDGKSSDNTIKIINSFFHSRIQIICEKDKGVYDAMNKGLKLAKGEWVLFLGSDDMLYDNKVLEDVYSHITKNKINSVIYGNVVFNGNAPSWARGSELYDGQFNTSKIISQNICHQSIFYNLSFIRKNKIKYNIRYPVCSDWDFNLKLWFKTDFFYIDRIISIFASDGISSNINDQLFNKNKESLIAYYSGKYFMWLKCKLRFKSRFIR